MLAKTITKSVNWGNAVLVNPDDDLATGTGLIVADGGNVGIGTTPPAGKLDVNGSIYQRGSSLHADYVFEPDYELESIEEHADYMWREKHLKAVPKASVDENGRDVLEIGAHRRGILEELEKAHVYIAQLKGENTELRTLIEQMNARLSALEGN